MMRALLLLSLAATLPVAAEEEKELPLGIEAVTGFRSDYVWRGFKVGDHVMDFQLQGEVALDDHWSLNLGGWYATETGDGDISDTAGFVELRYDEKVFSAGITITARDFEHPFLRDGLDFAPYFTWHVNDDFDFTAGAAWDTGADAPYGWLEGSWSKPLSNSMFVSASAGTSFVSDYYGHDGWNDLYGRVSLTYALNKRVAITPFVGLSVPMDSNPETNRLFGGVWLEVNF